MANPYEGDSNKTNQPGIVGRNTATGGTGVLGDSKSGEGVIGQSDSPDYSGVWGVHKHGGIGVKGTSSSGFNEVKAAGVFGQGEGGGVIGQSDSASHAGVLGVGSTVGDGGIGVEGTSTNSTGVFGVSKNGVGVIGQSGSQGHAGVVGYGFGIAVQGTTDAGVGVKGTSDSGVGVYGESSKGSAGFFKGNVSVTGDVNVGGRVNASGVNVGKAGATGFLWIPDAAGTDGVSMGGDKGVIGTPGDVNAGGAGWFLTGLGTGGDLNVGGNVQVTGDVVLANADCAEEFDVADNRDLLPGTVVILAEDGSVEESKAPYDTRVAGVVSGGSSYRPALILDRQAHSSSVRIPVALMGKVFCRADASQIPIHAGDLLTTSSRPGHAMRAVDRARAFGAIIGKALGSLASGTELIPVLITLQ